MTDFYGREIQIGDKCVLLRLNSLENVTVLDIDDYQCGRIQVLTSEDVKIIVNLSDSIVDITAIEREVHEQQFLNSVKVLDVKSNDTIVASIIPHQISLIETQNLFNALKTAFPNNTVSMVLGIDVTVE